MNILLAAATAAVFPLPGTHVTYAIHDTMPRGGTVDETVTLTGDRSQTVRVSVPGHAPVHVALNGSQPAHLDRGVGRGVHWLEVSNAIVQAALAGARSASVYIGPPGSKPVTLAISSVAGTITATGVAELPPPPQGRRRQGPPPQGDRTLHIRIVAKVVGGRLSSAQGEMTPAGGRGPHMSWSVSRKN